MEFVFEGVMGGGGAKVMEIIRNAGGVFNTIISDPIKFVGNLVGAVKGGFQQFSGNILTHLKNGLVGWLFGALAGAGLTLPAQFDLKGVVSLVLQVLGLTYQRMRGMLVKLIGEPKVAKLEKAFDFLMMIVTQGLGAAWEKITEFVGGLQEMVMGGIREWVQNSIITAAITKLLSMFNPAGAIIQAVMAIYNTIMFFIERGSQIAAVGEAVFSSIGTIAAGNIAGAATYVEQTMGRTLPVVISFLARLIGLGGISEHIKTVIKKIQAPIETAMTKVANFIVQKGKSLLGKGKDAVAGIVEWWKQRKTFKNKDGESHTLFFKGKGKSAELMMASNPTEIEKYLDEQEHLHKEDASKMTKIKEARQIHQQLKTITRAEVEPKDAEAITKNLEQLSVLLIQLGGSTAEDVELPAKADWSFGGGTNKFAQVEKLSTKTSTGGTARSSPWSPNGWHLLEKHGLTKNGDWARMHMISAAVGGKAEDQNAIPAPRTINSGSKVRSFENAVIQLVENKDKETKKPNVIWIKTEVESFHSAGSINSVTYGDTDFVNSISMRAGLHFYKQDGWSKDTKERISEDITILLPDFKQSSVANINKGGEREIAVACGCTRAFARELVKERVKNGNFVSSLDCETRIKNYWDNELKQKRGNPFNENLQKVIDALNKGNLEF
jgi:hypothetical protein